MSPAAGSASAIREPASGEPVTTVRPLLVLAVGNQLLSDDGVGLALLDELSRDAASSHGVEFVDGGTLGLTLLARLSGREAVIVLDAIALGDAPGTLHVLRFPFSSSAARSTTAHEANALELLRFAALLGELPASVWIAGIEPERLSTGIGLSEAVSAAVPEAVQTIRRLISELQKEIPHVSSRAR